MNSLSLARQFDQQFDALVRSAFAAPVRTAARPGTGFSPAVEVDRDGDDALVRVELPGLTADDVTVELDGDRLVVSGERRDTRERSEGAVRRSEFRYGSFRRALALPTTVGPEAVSATYDAGVLTVRVAGVHAAARPQRIAVTAAPAAAPAADEQPAQEQPAGE
ncbi:Hsp20/alpha crystallin family protein [Kineococcus sp. SYSU DK004]|uniref:Hsp20/alpha crystallin family protein n=1 Tax=Kineococcus sp. SYSU DK004 TaxID=3383125 RepID=UPI003D7CD756